MAFAPDSEVPSAADSFGSAVARKGTADCF